MANQQKKLLFKPSGILIHFCGSCNLPFFLLVWTLYNIVPKLLTSKALNFSHIFLLLTFMFSPTLGPLLGLLFSLCSKSNILIITITILCTALHISFSSFLLPEIIPKTIPTGKMLSCNNTLNKDNPLFGHTIQSSPYKFIASNNLPNGT